MSNEKPFTKDSLSKLKPLSSSIPAAYTNGTAAVLAYGADKYGKNNWSKCPKDQLDLYWDALYRHLEKYRMGELYDKDTGLSHLYHANCNLIFITELEGVNDDYKRKVIETGPVS